MLIQHRSSAWRLRVRAPFLACGTHLHTHWTSNTNQYPNAVSVSIPQCNYAGACTFKYHVVFENLSVCYY